MQRPTSLVAPLVVIHGPMFAGKTTEIVRRVAEARARGEHVLVVKPERDTRYAADAVVTHAGDPKTRPVDRNRPCMESSASVAR